MDKRVKPVRQRDGSYRYRITSDIGRSKDGKRLQKTWTKDTPEEAAALLAQFDAFRRRQAKDRSASRRLADAGLIPASHLTGAGRCTWPCLGGMEECNCRCGGRWHGYLKDILVESEPAAEHSPVTGGLPEMNLIGTARREGIRAVRTHLGLLAKTVAIETGIGEATIYAIEAGKQQPTLAQILALAAAYRLQLMTLDDVAATFGKKPPRRKALPSGCQ